MARSRVLKTSYTKDRAARQRRLKARGESVVVGDLAKPKGWKPSCGRCGDEGSIIEQGRGRIPCPDCQDAA